MAKHVAVVGAGLGGLRSAEQLRAAGHDGPVTVIGAEPYPPYNRPPLSKELLACELLGGVTDGDGDDGGTDDLAALHQRVAFRRRASVADVTFRLGAAVTAADLSSGTLALADGGTVRFDGLVAATGLRPRRLNVPGPSGPGSGRHVLRTLHDAARLRAGLRALLRQAAAEAVPASLELSSPVAGRAPRPAAGHAATTTAGSPPPRVVVVGAGFVGCEVACTARSLGCDVTVVEPAGPPMFRVLGEELASAVQASHERAGISFVIGQAVIAYAGRDRVTGVTLAGAADAGGSSTFAARPGGAAVLPADLVVEAIGSVPNTEWLAGAGLDLSDGVLCDNNLAAVTSTHPGALVTAVGDVARFPNPLFDDVPRRVEHWSMPTDTARRAAATVRAKLAGDPLDPTPFRPLPSFWSDQGELRMWSFGTPGLADDVVIAEGDLREPAQGLLAEYRRGGRLVGSVAVNLPPLRHRELRAALLGQ
ncbi:MAG TPA: FAD-dependent oxidoreductase [Trebonia sp.]|nr:FAD-dependent oxidoreductase [Trebonia sp.]